MEISRNIQAALKRNAANVFSFIEKKNKLVEKIEALKKEYEELMATIHNLDTPTRTLTGGYSTEDIINKVIVDTGKVDANGKPIRKPQFIFIYPDTIIPPQEIATQEVDKEAVIDEEEKVEEIETVPAEAPFNPIADLPY